MKKRKRINKSNPFLIKKEEEPTFLIYARARQPIPTKAKDLVSAIKKAVSLVEVEDLLEIHDEDTNLLWGKRTGINKEYYGTKTK